MPADWRAIGCRVDACRVSWNFYTWTFKQVVPCKPKLQATSRRNQCPEYPARSTLSRSFFGINHVIHSVDMTIDIPKQLESCILRDFVKEDAKTLADIEFDPIVKRYVGEGIIQTPRSDWEKKIYCDPGSLRGWAIEVIPEHVLGGRASLSKVKNAPLGTIELEIVIAKPFWGRGLGRQIAKALIQYVFSDPRAIAIVAEVHPENKASLQLLEAFKFIDTGRKNGNEHLIYELNRATYN